MIKILIVLLVLFHIIAAIMWENDVPIMPILFHNVYGWHYPDYEKPIYFDNVNVGCQCVFCGKFVMQDSQGNWF